MNLQVLDG